MNTLCPTTVITATAVITAALLAFFQWVLYPRQPPVLASPLRTVLPSLSAEELSQQDYPLDAFPGARDVPTPYGSIRVYEFGPATGRKVLLAHGISTSCMTLGPVARGLVEHAGCRVMLFDFFGRGFSDGVGDLPHDARLYSTQMLMALASSPLAWTGSKAFDLVGYSMGGGVAVHFATAFSGMLRSLVLLAPAGLIRPERFGVATRFVFTSGIVPDRLLAAATRRRLQKPIASGTKKTKAGKLKEAVVEESTKPLDLGVVDAAVDLHERDIASPSAGVTPPEEAGARLCIRVMQYVRWMITYHAGFVPAFMSCIRDAPLVGQQRTWAELARLVHGSSGCKGMDRLPLCVVLGETDTVVDAHDYAADALPILVGPAKVTWVVVPGGHEFPMTYSREVLRTVFGFWDGTDVCSGADM